MKTGNKVHANGDNTSNPAYQSLGSLKHLRPFAATVAMLFGWSCSHHSVDYPFSIIPNSHRISPLHLALIILWGCFAIATYLVFRKRKEDRGDLAEKSSKKRIVIDWAYIYIVAATLALFLGIVLGSMAYFYPEKVATIITPCVVSYCGFMGFAIVYAVERKVESQDRVRLWYLFLLCLVCLTAAGLLVEADL
jgi:purine-cytosine permease-like protein